MRHRFGLSLARVLRFSARRPFSFACLVLCVVLIQISWTASLLQGGSLSQWLDEAFLYRVSNGHRGADLAPRVHFLIPATDVNVNLCKTLLTTSILGFPSPSLLAWKEPYDENGGLGGGSHLLKISRTLQYLKSLGPDQDDDLVLMVDAYDIQFQLPFEVLIERYRSILKAENDRLRHSLGSAFHRDGSLRQKVIFGAGKRCAPNALWEVACYTVPPSPASDELYGNNTDTMLGHTQWFSCRQKFLNSGYIMGSVGSMRKLFERAQEKADAHQDRPIYGSSDQAIFALIMGEQNYARELKRLQHLTEEEKLLDPELARPRSTNIQGGLFIDNILNPSIGHTPFEPDAAVEYEFGITLDYLSELGHQTMNSDIDKDAQWVTWNDTRSLEEQVNAKAPRHGNLDCPLNVPATPPADLLRQPAPFEALSARPGDGGHETWADVPLYTHLCFGTVPVMIHHNGGKEKREQRWTDLWLQPRAGELLDAQSARRGSASGIREWSTFKSKPGKKSAGGAWTDRGDWLEWNDLCGDETSVREIFRAKQETEP